LARNCCHNGAPAPANAQARSNLWVEARRDPDNLAKSGILRISVNIRITTALALSVLALAELVKILM
jgi:hypothetical protein